jgi:hypothetical protein
MPGILEDFSHIYSSDESKRLSHALRADLTEAVETIKTRNSTRQWAFNGCSPARMEISVSL